MIDKYLIYHKGFEGSLQFMDNIQKQEMQNWKKILIMDPVLNKLFDESLQMKDFVHDDILPLEHQKIVQIYSRLSTIKHALSKNIHKEVESKHDVIEQSFLKKCQLSAEIMHQSKEQSANSSLRISKIRSNCDSLSSYNKKYESVEQNTIRLENINKILQFSKSLQKFKINVRLLKTFMKDFKQPEYIPTDSTKSAKSTGQSLNLAKISKLIKELTQIQSKHQSDLLTIKYYQNQKPFITNSKAILYSLTQKQLNKALKKYSECISMEISESKKQSKKQQILSLRNREKSLQQEIASLFKILNSLTRLKQFITSFFRGILQQSSQKLKKLFKTQGLQDFKVFFADIIEIHFIRHSRLLIKIQQLLAQVRLSNGLRSNGIPNLFQRFIDKLSSYLSDLIKWNVEQQAKQKTPNNLHQTSLSSTFPSFSKILNQIDSLTQNGISSKDTRLSSQKCCLVLKYGSLYTSIDRLATALHLQVTSHSNLIHYEFAEKRQNMMTSLLPLALRFHSFLDALLLSIYQVTPKHDSNDGQGEKQNQFLRIKCFLCEEITKDGQLLSVICEKVIKSLENNFKEHRKQKQTLTTQKDDGRQSSIISAQESVMTARNLVQLVNRPEILSRYRSLHTVINHVKRIRKLEELYSSC